MNQNNDERETTQEPEDVLSNAELLTAWLIAVALGCVTAWGLWSLGEWVFGR